ncbi:MAG: SRPBCC family protein [Chitinophagaceae bacterium]|nr:SRPBCC family protein [Chitinophagaceae bacterium]
MRLIKLALLSFIFLFLLVTIISLFVPSHVIISRAINIKANKDSVLSQIKDPARWKNWHPGLDTAQQLMVEGKVNGVVLDATDITKPIIIILDKVSEEEVTAMFFPRKMKPVKNTWRAITHPGSDSTTVQWSMDFHLRWYPWEKFGSLMLERSHGTKMEQGLTNLKKLVHRIN